MTEKYQNVTGTLFIKSTIRQEYSMLNRQGGKNAKLLTGMQ